MKSPDYTGTTHSEELFAPQRWGTMTKQDIAVISPLLPDVPVTDFDNEQDFVPIHDEDHEGDRQLIHKFFDSWMEVDEANTDLSSNPDLLMKDIHEDCSQELTRRGAILRMDDNADSSDNDSVDHSIETPETIAEDATDTSSEQGYDVCGHFRTCDQSDTSDQGDAAIETGTVCPSEIYREEHHTPPSSGDELEVDDQNKSFAQYQDDSYVSRHSKKTSPRRRQARSRVGENTDWEQALEILKRKLPDEDLSLSRTSDGRRLIIADPQTHERLIITNPSGTRTYYATPTLGFTLSGDDAIATKVLSVRTYDDEVETEDGQWEQAFLPGEHLINLDLVENSIDRRKQLDRDGAELRYVTGIIASLEASRESQLYLRNWSFAEAMDMWRESIRETVGDWALGEGWSTNYQRPVWFEHDCDTRDCEPLP